MDIWRHSDENKLGHFLAHPVDLAADKSWHHAKTELTGFTVIEAW